jgi:hypothetical protein
MASTSRKATSTGCVVWETMPSRGCAGICIKVGFFKHDDGLRKVADEAANLDVLRWPMTMGW